MRYTPFAGLTELDPDDAITVDGGSFLSRNPAVIDLFLRIGALSHRHDAHAALDAPHVAITGSALNTSGGSLEAGTEYAVTYTLLDAQGGETLAAPPLTLSTGGGVDPPASEIAAEVDFTAGIMPAGTYFYGRTFVDGEGGETPIGPTTVVYVDPGFASAQVMLSGLSDGVPAGGAWRLWRSYEGEDWHLVYQDTAGLYTDTGFDPPDNPARPPETNETGQTWALSLTLPTSGEEPAIADASAIRIYLAPDTSFASPCLYAEMPTASGGATITVLSDVVAEGNPPPVPTAIAGAAKIDPDTDMIAFPWKRAVLSASDLPSAGNEPGDVRVTLDDLTMHIWNAATSTWDTLGGGVPAVIDGGHADSFSPPPPPSEIDGGIASTSSFADTIDGGVSGTTTFTTTIDGGSA